jgi:hypothetical protein
MGQAELRPLPPTKKNLEASVMTAEWHVTFAL